VTDDERAIEVLLRRYRPAGPPDALRQRVLGSRKDEPVAFAWREWLLAAALAGICLGLSWSTARAERRIEATGRDSLHEREVDAVSALLNGDAPPREYLARAMRSRPPAQLRALLPGPMDGIWQGDQP
jgi:hypothetical protein